MLLPAGTRTALGSFPPPSRLSEGRLTGFGAAGAFFTAGFPLPEANTMPGRPAVSGRLSQGLTKTARRREQANRPDPSAKGPTTAVDKTIDPTATHNRHGKSLHSGINHARQRLMQNQGNTART